MSTQSFDELVDDFELLDDWEERYRYVIELGKNLPPFPSELKDEAHKVDGCVSQVWLDPHVIEGDGARRIEFQGDSDAHIVRGLIAILRILLSGRSAEDIRDEDVMAALQRIDLSDHLSPQRSNGLGAMITRIQSFAASADK